MTMIGGEAVPISKQLVCQKYIFKIHSSRLRRERWKLTLPLDEARKNDEVISLADSQVLRWIDEITDNLDADARAKEIKKEIKHIKKEPNSLQNKKRIKQLYSELDEVQFKSDYLCLIIDKEKDYWRACKGFSVNGVSYVRLLATNGGVKNSTIVFVSDRVADELRRRIENGRNPNKELVTAKLEAYKALACSASTPVSFPNGVLVVKDCMVKFKSDIIYLSDENDGEPVMELRKDEELEVDVSDGYGLMLPSLAERWSEELGLDYMMAGCNTRMAWTKGMVFTFDFIDFADKVAGKYIVKDFWGNDVDVRNVELILTESMVKLADSYRSLDDFMTNSINNKYTFAVTKTCPKELEHERRLNYQFIQSYDLNDDDIEELIAPTIAEFKDVLGLDWAKAVLFTKGSGLNDDNIHSIEDDVMKAVMIDHRMIKDPYIQNMIYNLIKARIDDAKVGVIGVHGNYSILSGDPYALCQSIFGLEVTGLLAAGEIYNKYWSDLGANELVCFRAPMTCHNNIRRVHPSCNEDQKYWFRFMNACTIVNAWDTMMSAMNGADEDGDLCFLTDNDVLIRKHIELPALMCAQRKASKRVSFENDFIASNIASFGNDIGKITNRVTSMFEVRSYFSPGSKEYEVLSYRIQCGQLYQQNAIDKAKGIISKPMPKEWYDWHSASKLTENAEFYQRILAEKKPYFMRYIYPSLMKQYKKHVKNTEYSAMSEFKITVSDLKDIPEDKLTDRQREFLKYYDLGMPVGTGNCVMNKICRRIEEEFDGHAWSHVDGSGFDYSIMKSGNGYPKSLYYELKKLYDEYNRRSQGCIVQIKLETNDKDKINSQLSMLQNEFMTECSKLCPDSSMLCDILLDICYQKSSTKKFVWSMCASNIIENLSKKNNMQIEYPTLCDDGDIKYAGNLYKLETTEIEEDE